MAAPQDQRFLDRLLELWPESWTGAHVADVGAYDVNGNPRAWVEQHLGTYRGFDARPGPNVDRVIDVCAGPLPPDPLGAGWRCILCLNTLEHTREPWRAVAHMIASLRKGGLLLLVAPEVWPEHEHPVDFWRFLPSGLAQLCRLGGMEIYWQGREVYGGPGEINAGVIARRS